MTPQQTALEHLQVIRSLMEKAHIYRAISAPAGLVGGLLASGLAAWSIWIGPGVNLTATGFLSAWLSVFLLCSLLNASLLSREAKRRGQPLVSDDMRLALRSLAPALGVGGVTGICLAACWGQQTLAALIWVLCYALALLATSGFSPRSLRRLGGAFLVVGLLLFVLWSCLPNLRQQLSDAQAAAAVMGLTFGLLHLAYGIAVLSRQPHD